MRTTHRLIVELRRMDGTTAHAEAIVPDWEPAEAWTRFAAARALGLTEYCADDEPVLVPLWSDEGEPHLHGFRVCISNGEARWSEDFVTSSYFADAARAIVLEAYEAKRVAKDEPLRWALTACSVPATKAAVLPAFRATSRPTRWHLQERPRPHLVQSSQQDRTEGDADVVMARRVLDEVQRLAAGAGERETGGVLVGHLCRDAGAPGVWVDVTAQIPARHTTADAVTVTFTADTWTDVRNAIALRGGTERLLGWWHSHPANVWCATCPEESQRRCHLAVGFLSPEDRALHRTVFPDAYSVALVVTTSITGTSTRLFGWRRGLLEPRGFHLAADGGREAATSRAV